MDRKYFIAIVFTLIIRVANCESKGGFYFTLFNKSVTLDHWEDNPIFSFDNSGVLLTDTNYNIVSISQYALKLFDEYKKSGEITYLLKFNTQVSYLFDVEEREGYYRKFSYNFQFHNLKSGWYSGLAQAEVAMVYLRYYSINESDSIIDKIIGVVDFMIYRLAEYNLSSGKSASYSQYFWIQEYINSDIYNYVLNGALTSLISLYEVYSVTKCEYYYHLFQSGLNTVIKTMPCFINAGDKILYYDLKSKSTSSAWYVKSLYLLLEDLYSCYKDSRISHMLYVVSYLSYDIKGNLPHCLLNDTLFAAPCRDYNEYNICFELSGTKRELMFFQGTGEQVYLYSF